MAESAGSIYADVRVRLDALDRDIKAVKEKFAGMGKSVGTASDRAVRGIDGLAKSAAAGGKKVAALGKEAKATGGKIANLNAETVEAEEKLDGMASGVNEAGEALDGLGKKAGEAGKGLEDLGKGAEGLGNDIPETFDSMGDNVKNILGDMGDGVVGQFVGIMRGVQKAIKAAPIVGAIMAIVGAVKKLTAGLARFVNETSEAFIRHQQELAKIGQIIQTTGASAWTTTRQLREAAFELANTSGRTIDEVLRMQSVLLTFRGVTGEVFGRAQQAVTDMAAVMGGDLARAAQYVGRALEAPAEAMRILQRQGVMLTQAEKARIETLVESGQQMEAQTVILDAMHRSFYGVAVAINNVNAAQSDFATQTERLRIAQGEATTGIRMMWYNKPRPDQGVRGAGGHAGVRTARAHRRADSRRRDGRHRRGQGRHGHRTATAASAFRQRRDCPGEQHDRGQDTRQGQQRRDDTERAAAAGPFRHD